MITRIWRRRTRRYGPERDVSRDRCPRSKLHGCEALARSSRRLPTPIRKPPAAYLLLRRRRQQQSPALSLKGARRNERKKERKRERERDGPRKKDSLSRKSMQPFRFPASSFMLRVRNARLRAQQRERERERNEIYERPFQASKSRTLQKMLWIGWAKEFDGTWRIAYVRMMDSMWNAGVIEKRRLFSVRKAGKKWFQCYLYAQSNIHRSVNLTFPDVSWPRCEARNFYVELTLSFYRKEFSFSFFF